MWLQFYRPWGCPSQRGWAPRLPHTALHHSQPKPPPPPALHAGISSTHRDDPGDSCLGGLSSSFSRSKAMFIRVLSISPNSICFRAPHKLSISLGPFWSTGFLEQLVLCFTEQHLQGCGWGSYSWDNTTQKISLPFRAFPPEHSSPCFQDLSSPKNPQAFFFHSSILF